MQALEMLDVERRIDVDPGVEQFFHIFITCVMAAAGSVGVGRLVPQHQRRPAREDGVDVHLFEHVPLTGKRLARDDFEPGDPGLGFRPAMAFDHADHHIDASFPAGCCFGQHLIGLADARCGA
jgi:hypothetical protein